MVVSNDEPEVGQITFLWCVVHSVVRTYCRTLRLRGAVENGVITSERDQRATSGKRPRQTTRTTNERALARQPTRRRQSRQSRCISAFRRFSQILAPSLRGARALISSIHHDSPRVGVGGTFQHSSRPGATAGHDTVFLSPPVDTSQPGSRSIQWVARCKGSASHIDSTFRSCCSLVQLFVLVKSINLRDHTGRKRYAVYAVCGLCGLRFSGMRFCGSCC